VSASGPWIVWASYSSRRMEILFSPPPSAPLTHSLSWLILRLAQNPVSRTGQSKR
jgi:hypothetical protein